MRVLIFLFIIAIIVPVSVYAQLPKVGSDKKIVFAALKAQNSFIDSVLYDESDLEGNDILRSYSAAPINFHGLYGFYRTGFDKKGKSILEAFYVTEDWSDLDIPPQAISKCMINGTIERVKAFRDSLSVLYGKPKRTEEKSDIYTYIWSTKPVHKLYLSEGRITYFHFK